MYLIFALMNSFNGILSVEWCWCAVHNLTYVEETWGSHRHTSGKIARKWNRKRVQWYSRLPGIQVSIKNTCQHGQIDLSNVASQVFLGCSKKMVPSRGMEMLWKGTSPFKQRKIWCSSDHDRYDDVQMYSMTSVGWGGGNRIVFQPWGPPLKDLLSNGKHISKWHVLVSFLWFMQLMDSAWAIDIQPLKPSMEFWCHPENASMSQPFKTNISCDLFQDMYVHKMKQDTLDTYNLCLNPCSLFLFFKCAPYLRITVDVKLTKHLGWGAGVAAVSIKRNMISTWYWNCARKKGSVQMALMLFCWACFGGQELDLLAIEYRLCAFQQKV